MNNTLQESLNVEKVPFTSPGQNDEKPTKKPLIMMIALTIFVSFIGISIGYILNQKTINTSSVTPTVQPLKTDSKISITASPAIFPTNTIFPQAQSGNLPTIGNCSVFPIDNPWNQDISKLPVSPLSEYYISSIGLNKNLHPDFGGASSGNSWGIPYMTVTNTQQLFPITFTAYGEESDPGPYPIPLNAPIEGGSNSTGDRHVLVVNTDTCILYEIYRAFPTQTGWNADSGAIFDLSSNKLRTEKWTSADAAGLPIFPGLVKYDEVAKGSVNHAIRFTTKQTQKAYIYPANHYASTSTDPHLPPMGLRVRLKNDFNTSNLPKQAKVIATAMKKYGLILADNGGDWFFQGDTNRLWDDNDINTLKTIPGSAFEAVDTGPVVK